MENEWKKCYYNSFFEQKIIYIKFVYADAGERRESSRKIAFEDLRGEKTAKFFKTIIAGFIERLSRFLTNDFLRTSSNLHKICSREGKRIGSSL